LYFKATTNEGFNSCGRKILYYFDFAKPLKPAIAKEFHESLKKSLESLWFFWISGQKCFSLWYTKTITLLLAKAIKNTSFISIPDLSWQPY